MRLSGHSVRCVRGGREVFSGLDFAISAGEALAVTGSNGSGKTSLLRLIAGVLTAAVLVAASVAVALSEVWRAYQPPAPINNRAPAAMAPNKNFLLDLPEVVNSANWPSCSSARKWVPKDEVGKPRLAFSGVSVISVTDRSLTTGISPKSSAAL